MNKTNVIAMFLEYVRPHLSYMAGFPVEMLEVNGQTIVGEYPHCILLSRMFGGFTRAVNLEIADMADACKFEQVIRERISKALAELEIEAECRALVNYRWPAA